MHMSAFMVEDATINRVVTWLKREVQRSRFTVDWLAREYDGDLSSDQWHEKLERAMFQLNFDALACVLSSAKPRQNASLALSHILPMEHRNITALPHTKELLHHLLTMGYY